MHYMLAPLAHWASSEPPAAHDQCIHRSGGWVWPIDYSFMRQPGIGSGPKRPIQIAPLNLIVQFAVVGSYMLVLPSEAEVEISTQLTS